MKVRVTPPGKEPRPAEVHAEDGDNTEWVGEEGSYKYHLGNMCPVTEMIITNRSASIVFC